MQVYCVEPGVPYRVSVAAVNRAGLGETNTKVLFTKELREYTEYYVAVAGAF